jgi:hypothetical protein
MKLIYYNIIMLILISIIPLVSSEVQTLGTVKQGQCIVLTQLCADCTFVNLTSVIYPNESKVNYNVLMTKNNVDYNYTFCNTGDIGNYIYNTLGNPSGTLIVQPVSFEVTPSGNPKMGSGEGLTLMGILVIILLVSGFFLVISYMSNNQVVKSMFIGLSAFIMALAVFFGMTTINENLGGFSNLIKGYYTFWWFIVLVIFMSVMVTLVFVLIKSIKSMRIRKGDLDAEHYEPYRRLG